MSKYKIYLLGAIAAVIILAVVPVITQREGTLTWFILTLLFIALAQSWNIIGGFAGQINLGHAALFGFGALVARIILPMGVPFVVAMLGGALAAVVLALIIGLPVFRLKGIYFVIGTLVLAEIMRNVFGNMFPNAFTLPMPMIAKYSMVNRYYVFLVVAIIATLACYLIRYSKLGLALMALREEEDAAKTSGVNVARCKLIALVFSAFLAGLAGGAFVYYAVGIHADYIFSPLWTFNSVVIVFVGGLGSIIGPIIGAAFFVLLQEFFILFIPGGFHLIIFGLIFILIVIFLPGGLIQFADGIGNKIRMKYAAK